MEPSVSVTRARPPLSVRTTSSQRSSSPFFASVSDLVLPVPRSTRAIGSSAEILPAFCATAGTLGSAGGAANAGSSLPINSTADATQSSNLCFVIKFASSVRRAPRSLLRFRHVHAIPSRRGRFFQVLMRALEEAVRWAVVGIARQQCFKFLNRFAPRLPVVGLLRLVPERKQVLMVSGVFREGHQLVNA